MTDENPTPTTRTPIPEPPEAPTGGWPGTTSSVETPDSGSSAGGPSLPPPSVPPPPLAPPPLPGAPRREEKDRGRTASILFGLVILGLGLWFFAEHTLGYELPRIRWSQLWPVFLIGLGLWVVFGSLRRGSR